MDNFKQIYNCVKVLTLILPISEYQQLTVMFSQNSDTNIFASDLSKTINKIYTYILLGDCEETNLNSIHSVCEVYVCMYVQ